MTPEKWEKVNQVFLGALEVPAAERDAFVDSACGDDADLRIEVQALLNADTAESPSAQSFLRQAPVDVQRIVKEGDPSGATPPKTTDEAESLAPERWPRKPIERDRLEVAQIPEQIGPYRVVQKLGEGGMGVVCLAEQEKPLRRRVAIKIIKLGMDTLQVIARFEAERQALALMQHPNVARVFDAGATESGRPYFVMEYVPGERVTVWCDRKRLSIRERLELFLGICAAVQHAHQKGIIHRDLKPSNVLVMETDGKPVPKVIDFGIAKATGEQLTEHSIHTQRGQLIGTPAYMSPEQAGGRILDVDTRTDVYSLGVLLYELLVGVSPWDRQKLLEASPEEFQRLVEETDPRKPSGRATQLGPEGEKITASRGTDSRGLARALRGELDWIVMRAMEKERDRRYQTVAAFADDVQRYLRVEPVAAGPPGAGYRARKFVRRNRGAVVAASLIFLTLCVGLAVSLSMYMVAEGQRRRADRKAETAERVKDFLIDLFHTSDPSEAQANAITARELLDRGKADIEKSLSKEPQVQSELLGTMGRVYSGLGLSSVGRPMLERAVEIQRADSPTQDRELAMSLYHLGGVLLNSGEFDAAKATYQECLIIRKRMHGDAHADVADAMHALAVLHHQTGQMELALAQATQAGDLYRLALGENHPRVAAALVDLAAMHQDVGRLDDAKVLYERALAIHRRVLGDAHWDVALDLNYLGTLSQAMGDAIGGERYVREALATYRRVLSSDADHDYIASALNVLGALLHDQRRLEEAEAAYREALNMHRRLYGEEHHDVAGDMTGLAAVLRDGGNLTEAESMLRQALDLRRRLMGNEHMYVGVTLTSLGVCLTRMKRFEEAEAALLEAQKILAASVDSASPRRRRVREELAALYDAWGKPDLAVPFRELEATSLNSRDDSVPQIP